MRRRDWLGMTGAAGLTFLGEVLRQRPARAREGAGGPGFGRAKSVLIVLASGGQSQLETWDPRPDAPLEVRGQFGSRNTHEIFRNGICVIGNHHTATLPCNPVQIGNGSLDVEAASIRANGFADRAAPVVDAGHADGQKSGPDWRAVIGDRWLATRDWRLAIGDRRFDFEGPAPRGPLFLPGT